MATMCCIRDMARCESSHRSSMPSSYEMRPERTYPAEVIMPYISEPPSHHVFRHSGQPIHIVSQEILQDVELVFGLVAHT